MERKTTGKSIEIKDFLELSPSIPVFDVRSPAEFLSGHIKGATSLPLFENEERAKVGTLYKLSGKKTAFKKGLEIVGPKMLGFIEQAELARSKTIALYCWRGGMRSGSMAWLMESYGFETILLQGGYKAYRNEMLDFFSKKLPLQVITGFTGSKKTHFLHLLKENGEQIVDLEGLAGHQGSSFGNKKSKGQPTTEQFQNLLFEEFRTLDKNRPIWVEDESIRIGNVNMPQGLFDHKNQSPHIVLEIEKAERVDFLLEDYGNVSKEKLIEATVAIQKRLGGKNTEDAIQYIKEGKLAPAVEIILTYYDANYQKSIQKKKDLVRERIQTTMAELPQLAKKFARNNTHAI